MAKRKRKILPASSIVTQSNELISARYVLPLGEQRLLLAMISRIQPDDEDFKPHRISIAQFADFLGVDKNSAYRECKKITKALLSRVIEIDEPGRLLQTNWVSSAEYIDGTGMVNLTFDPLLKPYLLQLKGNFTSCKLEMLLGFKSQYTIRVYTLLKQYSRLKQREIELAELREILGLREDQHREYKNFKTNILLSTQKELEAKADLTFTFDEIKYGRRVGAIRFHIDIKQRSDTSVIESPIPVDVASLLPILTTVATPSVETPLASTVDQLIALVLEQHRNKKTVKDVIVMFEKKCGFAYVKRNILYCNAKAVKSYAGFLANALKEDWGHDWELEQQAKPTKPKTPEVWQREGFVSEKEYIDVIFRRHMESFGKVM